MKEITFTIKKYLKQQLMERKHVITFFEDIVSTDVHTHKVEFDIYDSERVELEPLGVDVELEATIKVVKDFIDHKVPNNTHVIGISDFNITESNEAHREEYTDTNYDVSNNPTGETTYVTDHFYTHYVISFKYILH